MADAAAPKAAPYNLNPAFEAAIGYWAASDARFFGQVGNRLEVDLLALEPVKLVLMAVRAIEAETGRGPGAPAVVLQRLHRWMHEGRVAQRQINGVLDLLIDVHNPPPLADVVAELAPVLRRRVEADLVRQAMDVYAKRGDVAELVAVINDATSIGRVDNARGLRLDTHSAAQLIRNSNTHNRQPIGVDELDVVLRGGQPRGTLTVFVGGTTSGKSMALVHVTAHALTVGRNVAYVTLELEESDVLTRVVANLTGYTINELEDGSVPEAEVTAKLAGLWPNLGRLTIKHFAAGLTTPTDVRTWVQSIARDAPDDAPAVLVVDYADKMTVGRRGELKKYEADEAVFEGLRHFVLEERLWGFTASQARRKEMGGKKRLLGNEDLADSQGKARVADALITMNPEEDAVIYHGAKMRKGGATTGWTVGPLSHNFAAAQLVPLDRRLRR